MSGLELGECERFRVKLIERRPYMDEVNPGFRLWGKEIILDLWTEYRREELRGAAWERSLKGMLEAPALEWEGDRGRGWEPLSTWRLDKERRETRVVVSAIKETLREAKGGASFGGVERILRAGQPGRRKGSGLDILVFHLREVEEVEDYEVILTLVGGSGVERFVTAVREWEKQGHDYARKQARDAWSRGKKLHVPDSASSSKSSNCPYCGGGLPPLVREMLARVKSS